MVIYRLRPLGGDDVTVEIRKRLWYTGFLFWKWEPYSTVRSAVNEAEWKIIELIEKIEKLLAVRMALADSAENECREMLKHKMDKFGISEPLSLDDKTFKEWIKPYASRPDDKFKMFFNPSVTRRYGLNNKPSTRDGQSHVDSPFRQGGDKGRGVIPGGPGTIVGVMLPEHQRFSSNLRDTDDSVDQFVMDKGAQKSDGGNQAEGKKAQQRKIRQDNPFTTDRWENQKEWNEWIEAEWKANHGGDS